MIIFEDELKNHNYQIPTFQRDVVWDKENVKKLWDSIYKFYPLGSILVWKTDLKLHNHRSIGGHQIDDPNFKRYDYLEGLNMTAEEFSEKYPNFSNIALYSPEVTVTENSSLSEEGKKLYDQAYKSVQKFNNKAAGTCSIFRFNTNLNRSFNNSNK